MSVLQNFFCVCYIVLALSHFRYARGDGIDEEIKRCVDHKLKTKFDLPLDVVNNEGELELWMYYNKKYDLYQTYNNGHIYHQEFQLDEKITPRTGADRANCSKFVPKKKRKKIAPATLLPFNSQFEYIASLNIINFSYLPPQAYYYECPYTVFEDEFNVNVTIQSFLRQVIYSIDKSTKDVLFTQSESGLYGPSKMK